MGVQVPSPSQFAPDGWGPVPSLHPKKCLVELMSLHRSAGSQPTRQPPGRSVRIRHCELVRQHRGSLRSL